MLDRSVAYHLRDISHTKVGTANQTIRLFHTQARQIINLFHTRFCLEQAGKVIGVCMDVAADLFQREIAVKIVFDRSDGPPYNAVIILFRDGRRLLGGSQPKSAGV